MTATVLVADDDAAIRTVVRQALIRAGFAVRLTETAAGLVKLVGEGVGDVVVTDVILPDANGLDTIPKLLAMRPGLRVIVMSAQNTLSTAVRATENGAFDYLPKPFDLNELVRSIQSALEGRSDIDTADFGRDDTALIGRSPAMQEVYRVVARVVPNDLTVMILGESGTGKELVARAIHDMGGRAQRPFIALNMAAIPRELIESELFGHERGAFTGAAARASGKFEQAQGGTLFLDEIGDMPIDAQTRLLRVLQTGEFTTVGGTRSQRADVRIVSATNQDLAGLIDAGRFREDLYYRLNVVPLSLPPLRARAEDIPALARHFLDTAAREGLPRKTIDAGAVEALQAHRWPGNVRELENLMRRLAVLERGDLITAAAVQAGLGNRAVPPGPPVSATLSEAAAAHIAAYFQAFGPALPPDGVYDRLLAEVERPLIAACLDATGGNQLKAAKLLGMNRNTLRRKLDDLGLDPQPARRG
ncbi:nitrogen regulation protein NR(I) [Polymorphobacter fuscus]|uniref:DNA-binding transcriptional regulator NtrC n=1 Tax=Sandarakinorhabdus fusca TaxID=1439888 RepID=A0A7C9KKF1_9SPHN|nr:nitrogen regulation protein NR(I) [Polymorphobacter fuscus]KAB7648859.1 nitrogen regulation protein NR(I) [Polymorphobacter fuscus]MQT16443.1 nitrogen regulation protein NR(I) [Polymorphobacter fuscus]NJC07267.1 two-component system nitrogen regulation response regulator GlnG [Polymorphobacter fuscus]